MTQATKPSNPSRAWHAFLFALGIAAVVFLPFIVQDGGYFTYYGDFNVQQIPFYKLAHEAVRSGNIWWNWNTDLGVNFIGSYSFYLLFSPFFWLTLPFPTWMVPYLMAPLLILKTALASWTAYLYLERFVKDRMWAVLGGLLYAFSGWMFFNIFFNHFHEVAVFFPLLLLSVEKLVCERKAGFFAAMVAVCAVVNYWFFVGEVVFVALYVFVRMSDPAWPMKGRTFVQLVFEAVIGVLLAAVVVLPAVMAITGNPRTGVDELTSGWGFWLYWHEQRQPAILHSLFFPPELPSVPNFFPDHGAKWASLSGWLPLVGMTGVIAYFFSHRRDWLKKILAICLVMALVPGLNSLFILLNNSYYARWFYMPVLLMILATVRALEEGRRNNSHLLRALKWVLIITAVYAVMVGLTPNKVDGAWEFGLARYSGFMWAYTAFAVSGLLVFVVLLLYLRHSRHFHRILCGAAALMCAVFGVFYISHGRGRTQRTEFVIQTAIGGRDYIALPEDSFARVDVYDDLDNLPMFWMQPTIQAFHSIVPPSIMEFYPEVGVKRDVGSRPEADYYALRPLLSVRWLFIHHEKDEQEPMPGYTLYTQQVGYNIYENDNYLPMGFGYDHYVTRYQLESVEEPYRSFLMLHAVVLEDDERAYAYDDILQRIFLEEDMACDYDDMVRFVEERRAQTAYYFDCDNDGFTARANLDSETLLFFSVPYEEGWSATVNGEQVEIEKVNIGFMGVRVPAGETEIRFAYRTPGLWTGFLITGATFVVFGVYLLLMQRRRTKKPGAGKAEKQEFALGPVTLSWEEYLHKYRDKEARATNLQQALNEASLKHIPEELPEEKQTLRFGPDSAGNTASEENNTDRE